MSWTVKKTIPILAVSDLDLGIEYYARLGFSVEWSWPDEERTRVGLLLGASSVMLALGEPTDRAELYFIVDDVAACHAGMLDRRPWELDSAADSAPAPPATPDSGYCGYSEFSIVDPWGHRLSFGQVIRPEDS